MKDDRPDRGIDEDLQLIHAHDGRIVSIANTIDERMVHAGEWFTDRDMSDRSRDAWIERKPSEKLRKLAKVMPKDWRDGEMLRDRTKKCFDYRNNIGHGTVKFLFEEDGSTIWERRSIKKTVPIDLAMFERWERRFAAIETSWKRLVYPGSLWMRDQNLTPEQIDLPGLVAAEADPLSLSDVVVKDWLSVVRWVFPPAK